MFAELVRDHVLRTLSAAFLRAPGCASSLYLFRAEMPSISGSTRAGVPANTKINAVHFACVAVPCLCGWQRPARRALSAPRLAALSLPFRLHARDPDSEFVVAQESAGRAHRDATWRRARTHRRPWTEPQAITRPEKHAGECNPTAPPRVSLRLEVPKLGAETPHPVSEPRRALMTARADWRVALVTA